MKREPKASRVFLYTDKVLLKEQNAVCEFFNPFDSDLSYSWYINTGKSLIESHKQIIDRNHCKGLFIDFF